MSKTLTRFYTAELKNNCPECFSKEGLELSFHQEWKNTRWLKKATHSVKEILRCNHCHADIYPVSWTEDIDRVYNYHLKLAEKVRYFRLKPLSWVLIGLTLIGLAVAAYFLSIYKFA